MSRVTELTETEYLNLLNENKALSETNLKLAAENQLLYMALREVLHETPSNSIVNITARAVLKAAKAHYSHEST